MNRRRFLGLFGLGAAGGLAGTRARWRATPSHADPAGATVPSSRPPAGMQRIVWSVDTDLPVAALTFDDGPDPEFTPAILDILDRYQVRATFMAMGFNVVQHRDILRRILAEGHELGGHGWAHLNLAEANRAETIKEVEVGTRRIEEVAETPIRVFRPPYGRFSEAAVGMLAETERDLVVWSVTRGHLGWKDPRRVADHVVGAVGPGDIIDLHDGIGRGTFNQGTHFTNRLRRRRMVEIGALPGILEGIRAKGIRLKTVSRLLALGHDG